MFPSFLLLTLLVQLTLRTGNAVPVPVDDRFAVIKLTGILYYWIKIKLVFLFVDNVSADGDDFGFIDINNFTLDLGFGGFLSGILGSLGGLFGG